jgi:DNA-binding CsgD family transcriptional regulator
MECRLRESEARLRDAQRGSRIGGWEWDMRADRVGCSLELYRVFGMAPGEVAPTWAGFLGRLPAATRDAVRESGRRALRSREAVSFTHESGNGAGTCVVEARAEVRRDDLDTPVRMIGTVRDVTGCAPLLSPRQRQVLDLLAHGLTGDEIACRLYLSGETVRTHVRNAMERLGAHTRGQAIALALVRQEIQRPDDSPL